jgi:glycosyltransferase involved in cell wall biosynthesis
MNDRPLAPERHIVLIITALGAGGAERVMTTMANHWVGQGHRVSFVTYEKPEEKIYYPLDPQVQVRRLDLAGEHKSTLRGLVRTGRRVMALRSCLKELRPDVAIAFLTRVNIATLLAASGLGLPVIVSERNHPDRQHLNSVWRRLRDWTYQRAARVVFQTEGAKACYPPELQARSTVIANPLRLNQKAANPLEKRKLVAVGRLTGQKGFDFLLRAFAKIAGDLPAWKLIIYGEGEERARLESLRDELGLVARVDLPGNTKNHGDWIDKAGLFVLSSRYEGQPNVLMEAMAAGLPVVAFDCPFGPGEMIVHGENGLLVPPEDVDALAENLADLMADDDKRARLATKAADIAGRYSHDVIMAKWTALLAASVSREPKIGKRALAP